VKAVSVDSRSYCAQDKISRVSSDFAVLTRLSCYQAVRVIMLITLMKSIKVSRVRKVTQRQQSLGLAAA
jgi:hypothetical protein